jgi:uncharacterized membrane protein
MRTFAKLLLAALFIGSGTLHLVLAMRSDDLLLGRIKIPADFYVNTMPDYIPAHEFMVQLSGVTEILAGVMLLIPPISRWGAWFIIAHLVAFFTVHFWMIQHAEDRYSEIPLAALWGRIVLQVVFIAWAMWFINDGKPASAKPAQAEG